MITVDATVITAIVGILSLLIVAIGGAYWLGRLSNRVDRLEEKVDQLDAKVDRQFIELRAEIHHLDAKVDRRVDELREEIRQLDAKFDRRIDELRSELLAEMRRGNQQLLLALTNHQHAADGETIFRVPVAAE